MNLQPNPITEKPHGNPAAWAAVSGLLAGLHTYTHGESSCCQLPAGLDNRLPMLEWLKDLLNRPAPRDALGDRGENVAARFLRNHGYKIIQRNFRCDVGEIDIIAKDGRTLVFAEVKTRQDDEPTPETQVDEFKRHQLTKAARFYLSRYGNPQPPARFDVVAIVWPPGRPPRIRHTPDAFEATF